MILKLQVTSGSTLYNKMDPLFKLDLKVMSGIWEEWVL